MRQIKTKMGLHYLADNNKPNNHIKQLLLKFKLKFGFKIN